MDDTKTGDHELLIQIRRHQTVQYWWLLYISLGLVVIGLLIVRPVQGQTDDRSISKFVLADLLDLDSETRPFVRYLSAPPQSSPNWVYAANAVVNGAISKVRQKRRGDVLAGGHLIRYDLRTLANEARVLARLMTIWDSLAERDPYYHLSKATAEAGLVELADSIDAAIMAPHIQQIVAQLTADLTFTPGAVYRYDFFQSQVYTAANTALGPGLYYDFLQLPKPHEGQSDLSAFLASLGIDYGLVDALSGERRIATFISKISGRARRIDTYIGNGGRRVWITQDIAESSVQARQHPVYSLVRFVPDAKEVIAERANGLHTGQLFNALGARQTVVPPDVAHDGTIPHPFVADLSPFVSCARCHGSNGGLQPVTNDVGRLLSNELLVLGDVNETNFVDLVDKLELLYGGNRFQRILDRGRIDHEAAMLELVGNAGIPPDVSVVGLVNAEIANIWSQREYTFVDAKRALGEITGEWVDENAPYLLKQRIAVEVGDEEDPAIAHLFAGGELRRADWDRVYALAALRNVNNEDENENAADPGSAADY